VGECDIILSNKGGRFATTFSEMQRVAVSAARAAIPFGDYFTGTDGAAPNAVKWTRSGAACTIDGNKLKIISGGGNEYVYSETAVVAPWIIRVWLKTPSVVDGVSQAFRIMMYSPNLGTAYSEFYNNNGAPSKFATYKQSGGWVASSTWSTSCVASTWYLVEIKQASTTSVTWTLFDVNMVQLETETITHDANASGWSVVLIANAGKTAYYDSVLTTSSSTVRADQLFEGYVDSIEYNQSPDTITLHCVDDAWELEKQYDDTYGAVTAELDPSYGATDDITAFISALLSSGWTYSIPDCAIHDHIEISSGTRRIDAINQVVEHTPYLGWFVLPMKHIVFVMPDTHTNFSPDAKTEDHTLWSVSGGGAAVTDNTTVNVDGTNAMVLSGNIATTCEAYLNPATAIDLSNYRSIIVYLFAVDAAGIDRIKLYTDVAGGTKYWYFDFSSTASFGHTARTDMAHWVLRLPDTTGDHGWTAVNSPSGNVVRVGFEGKSGVVAILAFDVCYFVADKKLTSKYTLTPYILSANRVKDANQIGQVRVQGSGVSATVTDATVTATYGLREQLINDQSITVAQKADAYGRVYLNAQNWDDTADPISVQVVNPGDMYNVVPGDTVTLTVANLNLSSATRSVMARADSVTEQGWKTVLRLSTGPVADRIVKIWELAKRKRY
jgi:hypothetical protein